MKQKDIALIIVVGAISVVLATVLSSYGFKFLGAKDQTAETVDVISSSFVQPDKKYFNANSIDPTLIIRIGEDSNQTPFNQAQ